MKVVDCIDLADVTSQKVEVIRVGARRFYDWMISFMNEDQVSVPHRDRNIQVGVSGIDSLNCKSTGWSKAIIIDLLMIRRPIASIVPMRREARPIAAWSMDFVDRETF
jgi:hypothetical protein